MKRSPLPPRTTRIKSKGRPRFKVSGQPDEAYREYIRSLPCLLAGRHTCRGTTEACHVKAKGAGGGDRGNLYPGCSRTHGMQHTQGLRTFEMIWSVSLHAIARDLEATYLAATRYEEESA